MAKPSPLSDDDDHYGSPTEKCGFFFHVATAVLSFCYVAFWCSCQLDENKDVPIWMNTVPATAVFLFYAAPLLYALINTSLVVEDIAAVEDEVSRQQQQAQPRQLKQLGNDDDERIPEIYDMDIGAVNDLLWETSFSSTGK